MSTARIVRTCVPRLDYSVASDEYGIFKLGREVSVLDAESINLESHQEGIVALVASGWGGRLKSTATAIAVKCISEWLGTSTARDMDMGLKLERAFLEANIQIWRLNQGSEEPMIGSNIVAFVLQPHEVWIAAVGYARAYLIRNGAINIISMPPVDVFRYYVTGQPVRSDTDQDDCPDPRQFYGPWLGTHPTVHPAIGVLKPYGGDVFLLGTEAVFDSLLDSEILELISQVGDVRIAVEDLISIARSRCDIRDMTIIAVSLAKRNQESDDDTTNGMIEQVRPFRYVVDEYFKAIIRNRVLTLERVGEIEKARELAGIISDEEHGHASTKRRE